MADKRNTIQKDIILRTVQSMCCHPTADAVYNEVVRTHPRISKATVYRNLNQLAEDGIISRLHIPHGADFYDFRTDEHYHIRCEQCGSILDLPFPYQHDLCETAMRQSDFELRGHSIIFFGICPVCKKQTIN